MKKASKTIVVLALFFAVFPFAHAESGTDAVRAATSTESMKWETLHLMRGGLLRPGVSYEVTLSEQEINAFIAQELETFKKTWFVDRAVIKLNEGSFTIALHVLRPIPGNLEVTGSLELRDGVAVPVVDSAWYGYFPAPASFVERIGNFITKKKSIAEWLSLDKGVWDSVSLHDDSLSFVVHGADDQ